MLAVILLFYLVTPVALLVLICKAFNEIHKQLLFSIQLLAFIVEGRRSSSGRRRTVSSTTAEYRQLSNTEEGVTDGSTRSAETPKGYAYWVYNILFKLSYVIGNLCQAASVTSVFMWNNLVASLWNCIERTRNTCFVCKFSCWTFVES